MNRPVSSELMRFHRHEQMKKLRAIFRNLLRFKKIDNFSLVTERLQSVTSDRKFTAADLRH